VDLESLQNNPDSLGKCDEHEIGRILLRKLKRYAGKLKSNFFSKRILVDGGGLFALQYLTKPVLRSTT